MTVACLGGCSSSAQPGQVPTGGPVTFVGDAHVEQAAGIRAAAGERIVFGATLLRNTGDTTAVLTSADLSGEAPEIGARVVEARVVDPATPNDTLVGIARWPFEDYPAKSSRLRDFELRAGQEAELLIIVEVLSQGRWFWPRTQVRYDVADDAFETETPFGVLVCPPRARDCEPDL